jgi:hypothetical protein
MYDPALGVWWTEEVTSWPSVVSERDPTSGFDTYWRDELDKFPSNRPGALSPLIHTALKFNLVQDLIT